MSRIRVGVVRGGPSSEYLISLKTGENVLKHLDPEKYQPIDILLTTRGDWYMNGVRTDLANIVHHVDVFWNALHGTFGEDGKAQQQFEAFNMPYTGSNAVSSAVGMHKALAKDIFRKAGLVVPWGAVIEQSDVIEEAALQIAVDKGFPLFVKPVSGGSSHGSRRVRTLPDLIRAITDAGKYGDVLVEEYIEGKEATVSVLDSGIPGEYFVLFPVEIKPPKGSDFFDYDAKYSGESEEICPGVFTLGTHSDLRDMAIMAHRAIDARHYSRSDFIITPEGTYLLEINTLPGLTKESLLPKALEAGGVSFPMFLDHVISLSLARK